MQTGLGSAVGVPSGPHESNDMRVYPDRPIYAVSPTRISLRLCGLRLLLRSFPPPRLKHFLPHILHDLEPFCGNAGEFGDCVAAGVVVNRQAVADQAQRLHGMRGVAEGMLDVEQKRDQG